MFVKRLDLVMTSKSIPSDITERSKELSLLCGVSPQAARKWLTEKAMPGYEHMMKIASRYSVTTSYLIGEIALKTIAESDKNSILKPSSRKNVITIDIGEDMFFGELKAGDTLICNPSNDVSVNGAIYLLQSANKRFFRRLSYTDEHNLIIEYDDNGERIHNVYTDKNMIELFLSSLVGKVEAVIRKIS